MSRAHDGTAYICTHRVITTGGPNNYLLTLLMCTVVLQSLLYAHYKEAADLIQKAEVEYAFSFNLLARTHSFVDVATDSAYYHRVVYDFRGATPEQSVRD